MKVFSTIAALSAFITSALALTDYDECNKKNSHAVQAIQKFCSNQGIMVPSDYAKTPVHVGTGGIHDTRVWIDGPCSPAQWVPQHYCLSQFFSMCADGDAWGGSNERMYGAGNDKCQFWNLRVKGGIGGQG